MSSLTAAASNKVVSTQASGTNRTNTKAMMVAEAIATISVQALIRHQNQRNK